MCFIMYCWLQLTSDLLLQMYRFGTNVLSICFFFRSRYQCLVYLMMLLNRLKSPFFNRCLCCIICVVFYEYKVIHIKSYSKRFIIDLHESVVLYWISKTNSSKNELFFC